MSLKLYLFLLTCVVIIGVSSADIFGGGFLMFVKKKKKKKDDDRPDRFKIFIKVLKKIKLVDSAIKSFF